MAKIRVGLIGLGFMGLTHYERYCKMENAEIVALADVNPAKRAGDVSAIRGNIDTTEKPAHLDFSKIAVYDNGFDLIANPDVDLVDICTPTPWHAELIIAALKAGKHVMAEKPMARTLAQAEAIGEALKTAKGQLNIGMVVRVFEAYQYLYRQHKAGAYGKLRSAVLRRVSGTLNDPKGAHWNNWFMNADYSGGALLDLHLHDTDFICYLLGRPKAVSSTGLNITSDHGTDHVVTRYHYDDGTMVMAEGNWACATGVRFSATFELIYEKATVRLMPEGFKIYWNDGRVEKPALDGVDGYAFELQYFVDCVQKGIKADKYQTFEDVMGSFKVVMAEQASVDAGGKRVEIK